MWGWKLVESLGQDFRYGLRQLRRSPGFTIVAVFTLALGIGANTAIFTVIRSVLLKPLEYREPDRLVLISGGATKVRYEEMKAAIGSCSEIGDFVGGTADITLSGSGEPEVLRGVRISANFLRILGVQPLLGRGFLDEEDTPAGEHVALISSELWARRFQGDPDIVGKSTTLGALPYKIVGVLPRNFQFPLPGVDVWVTRPREAVNDTSPLLHIFGRLKPGADLAQANAELAVLNQQYARAHPGMLDGKPGKVERVALMHDLLVANVRSLLWLLFGAVALVLLIACANVASLLLARGAARAQEFALRGALGADSGRLVRLLLAESVLLACVGGALGIWLAQLCLRVITHLAPIDLPRSGEIRLDGVVLGFAVVLSLVTGIVFGLAPSLDSSRPNLAGLLRASGAAATSTGSSRGFLRWFNTRRLLVVGQVALSMVLLIAAALLTTSLRRLYHIDPGFNPTNLLTMRISLPFSRYDTDKKKTVFVDELLRRLQSQPGIRNAAVTLTLPMTAYPRTPVQDVEQPRVLLNQRPLAVIENISPSYFQTLEIPLRRGREFTEQDIAGAPFVAIVNESLARVLWPGYPNGLDPVGQRILIGARNDAVEIVGVVADSHQSLELNPLPGVFRPYAQDPWSIELAVRTEGNPMDYAHSVSGQILAIDSAQPVSEVQTMEDLMDAEGGQRRLVGTLLNLFAGSAVLLALIGIYGVTAYSVAQRTQEIGIRRALGAHPVDVLRLVLGQGLALALAGITFGIAGALVVTRVMKNFLFQVTATDPAIFLGVALLFLIVALAASFIPAHRATRIDPMTALRMG